MVGWFVGGLTVALAMPPVEVAVQSQGSAPEVRSSSPSAPSSRRSHDDVAEASDSSGTVDDEPEAPSASEEPLVGPRADWSGYHGTGLRTVVDVQPYAQRSTLDLSQTGGPFTSAELVNLQPAVGDWYLLNLTGPEGTEIWHLHSLGWQITTDPADAAALWLTRPAPVEPGAEVALEPGAEPTRERVRCTMFTAPAAEAARSGDEARLGYLPLCQGRIYRRTQLEGRKTTIEWASDLLRDNVWGGEKLTVFVRDTFFKDRYLQRGDLDEGSDDEAPQVGPPRPKLTDAALKGTLVPENLGLPVPEGPMLAGKWVELDDQPGMFATVLQPQLVHPDVTASLGDGIRPLQAEEKDALVYLVAFDLDQFQLDYELGTDHRHELFDPRLRATAPDRQPRLDQDEQRQRRRQGTQWRDAVEPHLERLEMAGLRRRIRCLRHARTLRRCGAGCHADCVRRISWRWDDRHRSSHRPRTV